MTKTLPDKGKIEAPKWSPHPIYPAAEILGRADNGSIICSFNGDLRQLTLEELIEVHRMREEVIAREKYDPLRYGIVLDNWKIADAQHEQEDILLILGGNRASKSRYAAKRVVELMLSEPGKTVWCFHTSGPNSVAWQQPIIYSYLPPEFRGGVKKNAVTNISYSQKGGFTENTFVLPNKSQCWFMNYEQDEDVIEGGELDFIWCDELVPLSWIETLKYRLVTRKGKMLITFTPKHGWSPTVKHFLSGAVTIQDREAELLPKHEDSGGGFEKVPLIQTCTTEPARIVYFHSKDNPFGGYENIVKMLKAATREEILCRAYGVPSRSIASKFRKFRDDVHVVPADQIPKTATRYLLVDPCGGRNWFMIWVAVDIRDRLFIEREWPPAGEYIPGVGIAGPWAVPGKKHDGEPGPAQKTFGFGLRDYISEIERIEKEIADYIGMPEEKRKTPVVFQRYLDSRYGHSTTTGRDMPTTLIEELEALGYGFIPTPGEHIDEGIGLITDRLAYDEERYQREGKLSVDNEPHLYVSERCSNVIFALKEWTGADGNKGAMKDPVDVVRYAVMAQLQFVEGEVLTIRGGGYY